MLEKAWEYAVIASDGMGYEFTTEFNVFYIIAHMYYHFLNGGLGVRPFVDLWYIRNKTIFDENKVLHMCDACGIKKFYQECSFLPEVWFDERKHSKTSEMLEIVAIHGGLYGGEAFNYAVKQKSARGLKYLLNKLFPDSYHVSEFYKDPSGKKHILAYYYFKRLCSWSGKKRRKNLKKHVEGVFSVDKEQICFAKELLERLDI